jgi:hypothetical protein
MEESFYLQASLDATPERGTGERFSFSERPPSPLPHFGKSMVSAATYEQLETHLRQKEGELASYGSRLVYTLLFCCLIICCVNLQLMEEAHQQVSLLWPPVYTSPEITQNVTYYLDAG